MTDWAYVSRNSLLNWLSKSMLLYALYAYDALPIIHSSRAIGLPRALLSQLANAYRTHWRNDTIWYGIVCAYDIIRTCVLFVHTCLCSVLVFLTGCRFLKKWMKWHRHAIYLLTSVWRTNMKICYWWRTDTRTVSLWFVRTLFIYQNRVRSHIRGSMYNVVFDKIVKNNVIVLQNIFANIHYLCVL